MIIHNQYLFLLWIHFYTQWLENLGATPATVLTAGLLARGFAAGLRSVNAGMRENA